MKKSVLCAAAFTMLFGFAFTGGAMANEDKGPAEITMGRDGSSKPSVFPHVKHQGNMECTVCHEGDKHKTINTQADKKTSKTAGHALCLDCHKKNDNKKLKSCKTCHPKKKKAIEGC